MADDKETGVEPEVTTAPGDVEVPETPEVAETEDEQQDPVESLARDIGWTPKEEFKGDPEAWKPADEFIRTGRDVQRSLAKELKTIKQTTEAMARTQASLMQQTLADRDAYWASQHQEAVEQGDYEAVDYASRQRQAVQQQYAQTARPVITNEAAEFAERNKGWFQKDPLATRRAFEVTEAYAQSGAPPQEQLAAAERQIRKEFPELFGNSKPPPSVNGNGSRTASSSGRKKGFHDMPAEAQAVAKDMAERGIIPNTQAYVTEFFANQTRK